MLVEKDKLKQKMVEYISNQFWVNDRNPTFTEIYDQFQHYASKGSISSYLDELVVERLVVKENRGNNVFYGRPRMHIATRFIIAIVLLTSLLTIFSYIFFHGFEPLIFCLGCIFTAFIWRVLG